MSKQKKEQQRKRHERARRDRLARHREKSITINGDHEFEFGMTVHEEPMKMHPPLFPENEEKVVKGLKLGYAGKYEEAIKLLTEVNEAEPGRASILYNIAAFRHESGDMDGYNEIIDKLVVDFPNYLFGQVALARRLIFMFHLDEAWDILRSLYQAKSLHVAEVKALVGAMVTYYLAAMDMESAIRTHREGVEMCGDSFPPLKNFEAELKRHAISLWKDVMKDLEERKNRPKGYQPPVKRVIVQE